MVFAFHVGLSALAWHSPVRGRNEFPKTMHTWIKICGTTCVEDALKSIEAGADALGFIFAPSKRRVTPEQAQAIIRKLPPEVEKIGVFMDNSAKEIAELVGHVELTGIQMHGKEVPQEVYNFLPIARRNSMRTIKTVLVQQGSEITIENAGAPGVIGAWLLDSGAGSGRTFDWHAARAQLGEKKGSFIIAGGLTAENVGEAMRAFRPWGVDVVSGVEREPGRKDQEKLKAFVAAVRRAEQT